MKTFLSLVLSIAFTVTMFAFLVFGHETGAVGTENFALFFTGVLAVIGLLKATSNRGISVPANWFLRACIVVHLVALSLVVTRLAEYAHFIVAALLLVHVVLRFSALWDCVAFERSLKRELKAAARAQAQGVSGDGALASRIDTLNAAVKANSTAIDAEQAARDAASSGLGQSMQPA